MSAESEENEKFIDQWHAYTKDEDRVTNDPMEATYIGFNMWAQAVTKAGSEDVDKVRSAMYGITAPNLAGGTAVMNTNHHLSKPVLIGEIQEDGQFDIVWQTKGEVKGDAWTDFLPESKNLMSDWTAPVNCGNYNTVTKVCAGSEVAAE